MVLRIPAAFFDRLRPSYEGVSVCVTGGAGFIGGHLVDALLSLGSSVRVIDDLSNASAAHIAELIDLEPGRVEFVCGSILDPQALREATRSAEIVVHLAAVGSVPLSIEDPARAWTVNATGTVRVLEAARAEGSRRVVLAASSSAYGDSEELPKAETMAPAPASPYAASKLAGEHACAAWARSYPIDAGSLRFFNVFGPRQRADSAYAAVIPAFAVRLLEGSAPIIFGDGSHTRDYTYVTNAVLALLLSGASREPLNGRVLNVGAGRRTSLTELAELMGGLIGGQSGSISPEHRPERPGDVRHSQADIRRAREVLGYEPIVDLEAGLRQTIDWYRGASTSAVDQTA